MHGVQLMALCLGVESVLSSGRVRLQSVTVSQYRGWSELGAVHNGYTGSRRTSGI